MNAESIGLLVLVVVAFAYLVYALWRPEDLS